MWRAPLKLFLLLLGVLVVIPLGILFYYCKRQDINLRVAQYYFKYAAKVIGLQVMVKGKLLDKRPLIIISNHISYTDIIALGGLYPLIFAPKAEIADWPVIGWLSKLMGCVFIERKKQKTIENLVSLEQALSKRLPLVLFAEGTTSDSKRILPIRSSYFKIVEDSQRAPHPIAVQPALILYTRIYNLPIDLDSRHKIAWYGNMTFLPHVLELFQLGPIEVEVHFLPEIDVSDCKTRKEIAIKCEQILNSARHSLQ